MRRARFLRVPVLTALFFVLAAVASARAGGPGQARDVRSTTAVKAKVLQVKNYVLRLKDAYIVYVPSDDTFQIAALGGVLSYGDGWDRAQVKPYLYHLRHRSWTNHFWKVNTSRREVYLVWGGAFGRVGAGPGGAPAREVDGERADLTVEVVGGAGDRVPERFFIRLGGADLYFDPAARDLRLSAQGTTLSPCDDWEACELKDYLFHLRLKTWKGFYWKVNTGRMQAWRTSGGEFCELGGEDQTLDLTVLRFERPYSVARLRTALVAAETSELRKIAGMIEAGRPLAEVNKAAANFVRRFPGLDVAAAVDAIARNIKALNGATKEAGEKRQGFETSFENFDQKANQLFNVLSTVLKTMKEMQSGLTRNIN